ncbi:MAM and LDL-receptor class A domain-containing protein 1-like [Pecten maximus]|uniref:MAM and LDL-receptor class A domain-containing protein 1-like n=1 Tax=Pecten maximus TaxID=6579 RepID=UPI001458FF07|nr:MAM and LDL-receptor class A domain-containing protein 1-like [Pecten maximus]
MQETLPFDDLSISPGLCPLAGNCGFEKGFCTWTNMKNDDFDWLIGKGSTNTQFTGPTNDHTENTAQGHYAFIEASSPRVPGDIARIQSQSFTPGGSRCFHFWYFLTGSGIGSLNVYLVTASGNQTLWSLSGNQKNMWQSAQVSLNSTTQFTVIIEGIRGSNYQGDIAIDDVSFTTSSCTLMPSYANPAAQTTASTMSTPASTSASPTPAATQYDCNFDNGLCLWKQDTQTDQFNWTRAQGPTGSAETGPTNDHTKGTRYGWYIFIEASNPRRPNDTARVMSPLISDNSPRCLSFWYHMYGTHVNLLNVYQTRSISSLGTAIWSRRGTQGNQWLQAKVAITPSSPYMIVFEGVRGISYRGDIAIDDVRMALGSCGYASVNNSCDFESSTICGYTHYTSDQHPFQWHHGSTTSSGTGPSADHTLGTTAGHYVYMESSNVPVNMTTHLITPAMSATSGPVCVRFYYHMYGRNIGALNVFVTASNTDPSQKGRAVWTRNFNQGNIWHLGQATITPNGQYYVVFEAVRGTSYLGDIALDDVSFKNGQCSSAGSCDFEKGTCAWTNVQKGDDFDWLRSRGSTNSQFTGPTTDHTLGTPQGYYMFLETSAPRVPGDKARLASEIFPAKQTSACFIFYYHMYGADVNRLTAYILTNQTTDTFTSEAMLWTLQGQAGNTWNMGQINIPTFYTARPFQIILEGVRGPGYKGDMYCLCVCLDNT